MRIVANTWHAGCLFTNMTEIHNNENGSETMTATAGNAVVQVIKAVVDTVKESGPMGAPCGVIYSALMAQGCTLNQYQQIEAMIIRAGLVKKSCDCLIAC